MNSPARALDEAPALAPQEADGGRSERGRRLARVFSPVTANLARFLPARDRAAIGYPGVAFPRIPRPVRGALTRFHLAVLTFGLAVALPALLAFLYLAIVAVPQYRSEARFVVRGNLETVAGSAAPSPGGGLPHIASTQEARVIVDYLRSRAMVEALQQHIDLRQVFGLADRDPVFGLSPQANLDEIHAYWNRQVKVSLESLSGVIGVQVYAFSPESASLLAAAVVREAEAVTNALTVRNRGDRVLLAEAEERTAFAELAAVRVALEAFRNTQGTIDPTQSALSAYATIAKLRDQRSTLNTDLTVAQARLSDDSPVVRALKERLRSLDEKIAALDAELLGSSRDAAGSSSNLKDAAAMEVRRRLAEQRLRQAEAELLDARTQQARQQVYILAFMGPTFPVEKGFPLPFTTSATVAGVLFALWAVVALYVTSIYARTR